MKLLTAALATVATLGATVIATPAQATVQQSANEFCTQVVRLNGKLKQSAAPGTAMGAVLSTKTYNGFSYSQLWSLAKAIGTSSSCRRMY